MKIEWHQINSVNVRELDEQHKKMIGIINKFFETAPADQVGLSTIIQDLKDYANYHFQTEEKYFDKFHYANTEMHKRHHQIYNDKVADFEKNIKENGVAAILNELEAFLGAWWINHINEVDQDYTEFFNAQGLY